MTYKEETYVLKSIRKIRDQTEENNKLLRENNILLKQLCNYFAHIAANADNENMNDFGRNIIANLISTNLELNKNRRK